MKKTIFHIPEKNKALEYAAQNLAEAGITLSPTLCNDVTHILLPTPTPEDMITEILPRIPKGAVVIGGNLNDRGIDLLKDEEYLAKNAMITAHCAIKLALEHIDGTISDGSILIVGWGRIAKCLAQLLRGLGCNTTIAARKETSRAIVSALGFTSIPIEKIVINEYTLIYNTVPAQILDANKTDATIIELASKQGIRGNGIVDGRGLPGKYAPRSSGKLIADTIIKYITEADSP